MPRLRQRGRWWTEADALDVASELVVVIVHLVTPTWSSLVQSACHQTSAMHTVDDAADRTPMNVNDAAAAAAETIASFSVRRQQ